MGILCGSAVESFGENSATIAVEDAVENHCLHRVFVSCLFWKGFRHYGTTIVRLDFLGDLERGG